MPRDAEKRLLDRQRDIIEIKTRRTPAYNFEPQNPYKLINSNFDADEARVQNATYTAEIFLRQHRTHVFTVYIYRQFFRLFRWDHADILYSEPINFVEEPEKLCTFVYLLATASPANVGYDPSAILASEKEIEHLRVYTPRNDAENELKQDILKDTTYHPIYKVHYVT